jgi:hypothetical protein
LDDFLKALIKKFLRKWLFEFWMSQISVVLLTSVIYLPGAIGLAVSNVNLSWKI